MSNWQEVKIVINRGAAEGAYAILSNWGIETYAVDDSALINHAREMGGDYYRSGSFRANHHHLLFPGARLTADDLARLGRDLEELQDFGFPRSRLVQAGDQEADWAHAWKAFYRPLRVGRVDSASWESLPDEVSPTDLVVHLDPGMGFGSGTHPTTAMCVQILQDLNLS